MTGQPTAAEVMAAHPSASLYAPPSGVRTGYALRQECDGCRAFVYILAEHQADMLAAADLLATPEHDAQVAARTLREAAEDYTSPAGPLAFLTPEARTWLRACADRIERGEAT